MNANAKPLKDCLPGIICLILITVSCPLFAEVREFSTIASKKDGGTIKYFRKTVSGTERMNPALNRISMLSENQLYYPTPETGCGPTALLNILVWYEKFGLIPPHYRDANPRVYKLKLFRNIDQRLAKQSGMTRTDMIGTRSIDVAITMDQIVNERTKGEIRIHTDIIEAPLKLSDCLETTKNFRSGFLKVTLPEEMVGNGSINLHAAVIIRTDRAGYITLATWGEIYHGLLRERNGEQWFIPQNPDHMKLKVVELMRFVPYRPIASK